MRKLTLAVLAAGAAFVGPALAADMPFYPPIIEIPDVDYGYTGSFYLRGSAGLNALWAKRVNHPTAIPTTVFDTDGFGYGYSYGVGAGYETGTGLRLDVTVDRLHNDGLRANVAGSANLANGTHSLNLRSTVILANAYYDVGFGDGYSAAGGPFGYVGAGVGVAHNQMVTIPPAGGAPDTWGSNTSFAAAGMAGLGYDFGAFTTDLGYRALYINRIENTASAHPYSLDNNWVHEVRGTVRYRFN